MPWNLAQCVVQVLRTQPLRENEVKLYTGAICRVGHEIHDAAVKRLIAQGVIRKLTTTRSNSFILILTNDCSRLSSDNVGGRTPLSIHSRAGKVTRISPDESTLSLGKGSNGSGTQLFPWLGSLTGNLTNFGETQFLLDSGHFSWQEFWSRSLSGKRARRVFHGVAIP